MTESHQFPQSSANPVAGQDEMTGHITGIIAAIIWTELNTIHNETERINEAARLAIALCNAVVRHWS